jgi:hypothetical protein
MSTPAQATEYRPTFLDRHGPDGMIRLKSAAYGLMVLGLTIPLFGAAAAKLEIHSPVLAVAFILGCSLGSAGAAFYSGLHLSHAVGESVKAVAIGGASTPSTEQFSYQQSLVMKGKVDEALASYEAIINERPANVDVRVRAAELYVSKKRNFRRGADLFREAQGIPSISPGEDLYVTNRLVDLYAGPLATPGRALVELRRLIHRYPDGPAAARAKEALRRLKNEGRTGSDES